MNLQVSNQEEQEQQPNRSKSAQAAQNASRVSSEASIDKWQNGIQKDFWHASTMSSVESDIEPFSYDDALNMVGGFGRF